MTITIILKGDKPAKYPNYNILYATLVGLDSCDTARQIVYNAEKTGNGSIGNYCIIECAGDNTITNVFRYIGRREERVPKEFFSNYMLLATSAVRTAFGY